DLAARRNSRRPATAAGRGGQGRTVEPARPAAAVAMTLVYADTSALVKLCVLETGTPLAVALWEGADALVTSRIADAEVRSVLSAAERIGRIDAAPAAQARERWAEL